MSERGEEKRYTLAEAVEVMARYECTAHGHDLVILLNDSKDPVTIYCARENCHAAYLVKKIKDKDV